MWSDIYYDELGKDMRVEPIPEDMMELAQEYRTKLLDACADILPDCLPYDVRQAHQLCRVNYAYENIHFPESPEALDIARRRLAFEELFFFAIGLKLLRSRRETVDVVPFQNVDMAPFYRSLPFTLTDAQRRCVEEAIGDMCSGKPMNRLCQGDVGSGKTMVAAALCYLAAKNGKQAVMMAPTELLARQHMKTLQPILCKLGISCGLLVSAMRAKEKREIIDEISSGKLSVIIGTHAVLSEHVQFCDLALAVVDEQHRFGVNQRAALTEKGENVHLLVMSATPIPRTLALLIYGDLDVSIIDELPPGRQKIKTYAVGEQTRPRIDRFIDNQCAAGGQAYVVCPLVEDSEATDTQRHSAEQTAQRLKTVLPHRRIGLVHGRTKTAEKEQIMRDFADGNLDILVSTTVIEVGVNVPNATLMVVENADCFGMSQLHQLRGRVGRGSRQSFCVFYGADKGADARERLRTLVHTGDGFAIAQKDLEMRGAGDFFGTRQHGLPPLKLADLAGDARLLEQAQQAADALMARDPQLKNAPLLRQRIVRLFEQHGEGSFN